MEDVAGYLASKGLQPKRSRGNNYNYPCFFHGEDESDRGRLYINVDPEAEVSGLFTCFVCNEHGSLVKIKRHFGDPLTQSDENSRARLHVFDVAARHYHRALTEQPDVLKFLQVERGLSQETIDDNLIGWSDNTLHAHMDSLGIPVADVLSTGLLMKSNTGGSLYEFLGGKITIPYIAAGNVVSIRGKERHGKYYTLPGAKARLYNIDAALGADEVLVAEGENDAMVLAQLGYAAVGVPGANVWQEDWNSYFTDAKRVYLCFDNDQAGLTGAKRVKDSIGNKARIVTMPLGPVKNDPTEWIVNQGHTKADFDELLKGAKKQGSLLVTAEEAFSEHQLVQAQRGLRLGWDYLDNRIRPGLLPGQVLVLLSKSGGGKTVWLINTFYRFSLQQPDAKILFLSLEQTRGEWFERARRINAFHNIDRAFLGGAKRADDLMVQEFLSANDQQTVDYWKDRIRIVDKNRVSEGEFETVLMEFEDEMGSMPDLVAIDYLGYWAAGFGKESRYEKTSDAIMSIKAMAKEYRLPIITPHQVNRSGQYGARPDLDHARDSGIIVESADYVLSMWATDQATEVESDQRTGRLDLHIGKSRHGGVGTEVHLQFAPLNLTILPIEADPDLIMRARAEIAMQNTGMSWIDALIAHNVGGSVPSR